MLRCACEYFVGRIVGRRQPEEATRQEDAPIYCGSMEVDGYVRMSVVKEIICKRMENNGWIPVEKGLPEERVEVLAQFEARVRNVKNEVIKTTYTHVMYLEGGIWKSDMGIPNGKVIAWQPLPEPYRMEI